MAWKCRNWVMVFIRWNLMSVSVVCWMLLHQPYCDRYGAYRDLEKAYKAGKVRAIGVSKFFPDHLIDLASNMEIAPMVNQMETHVFNQQHETRKFMDEFGTKLMAWAPLAEGQN